MTNGFYRLATVAIDGSSQAVVERSGKLVPLAAILPPALAEELRPARDLRPIIDRWAEIEPVLAALVPQSDELFRQSGKDAASCDFLPPVALPNKLICIGANYHDHIAEMRVPMTPTDPYSFLKPASNTLRGSGAIVPLPEGASMFDWEAELAVIIGQEARNVPAEQALDIVAGYANFNDLSARDWVASRPPVGVDWVRHKAFDGFGPFGPYLVPARFIHAPDDLPIRLTVNGVLKQNSSTAKMVFGVKEIIAHLSAIMTLEPGDVIATGTPAGTAGSFEPVEWLKPGDEVRMEIGPLGELITTLA